MSKPRTPRTPRKPRAPRAASPVEPTAPAAPVVAAAPVRRLRPSGASMLERTAPNPRPTGRTAR